MQKNLDGLTDIRLKRDRKMHFENRNTAFCVKDLKIRKFYVERKISSVFF